MSDLDATLAFAKSTGSADVGRAAVLGFCWGGRQVWLYAAHNPSLKAAVAWYGPLVWRIFQPTPVARVEHDPPDVVGDLEAPVLGLYGGMDTFIALASIDAMNDKLAAAGGRSKIIVYPDAGHGFFADYRPGYNRADARRTSSPVAIWNGVTQRLFDFASNERATLTPNADGLLFIPMQARGKFPVILTPNKEYSVDTVRIAAETKELESLIAYVQKLGMNRGKWRDRFEPLELEVTEATLPRSNEWIAYGKEVYERRCIGCHGEGFRTPAFGADAS